MRVPIQLTRWIQWSNFTACQLSDKLLHCMTVSHTLSNTMSNSLSVRIPDDLRGRLDALAATERRTVSNLVVVLLEEALAARASLTKGEA